MSDGRARGGEAENAALFGYRPELVRLFEHQRVCLINDKDITRGNFF
jgi:hypothetical protein